MMLSKHVTLATAALANFSGFHADSSSDTATTPSLLSRQSLSVSADGLCSGTQTCLGSSFGESCSQWGYCGATTDAAYSGTGCQPNFGKCADTTRDESSMSQSQSTVSLSTFLTVTITASSECTTSGSTYASATSTPLPSTDSTSASSAETSASVGLSSESVQYTEYLGTGEPSEGWPTESSWLSLDQLFDLNRNLMSTSCKQWNVADNSATEITDLKSSIEAVAQSSGVKAEFILAIVLQESNGCVRAPTTSYSVKNPGLMQSYQGTGTCNPGTSTSPQPVSPCPASEITQMIKDGTEGTGEGSTNLVTAISKADCSDVSQYYKAARIYNSGSIDVSGLLQDGVATHCYASDVANRLLGWSAAPSKCTLNSS